MAQKKTSFSAATIAVVVVVAVIFFFVGYLSHTTVSTSVVPPSNVQYY
ncbi:hypothetical protein M1112_00880 [Candidatus Parvarchaeota archaeon]|nr:hypothetical protein [Candidatus Parvarchaeota archaeon]